MLERPLQSQRVLECGVVLLGGHDSASDACAIETGLQTVCHIDYIGAQASRPQSRLVVPVDVQLLQQKPVEVDEGRVQWFCAQCHHHVHAKAWQRLLQSACSHSC